jgi:hypothetical protein
MIFQTWRTSNTFYFNIVDGNYYSLDKHQMKTFLKWNWKNPVVDGKNIILTPAVLGEWNE